LKYIIWWVCYLEYWHASVGLHLGAIAIHVQLYGAVLSRRVELSWIAQVVGCNCTVIRWDGVLYDFEMNTEYIP
jgi:hypothetical protein